MDHEFFKGLNWEDVYKEKLIPPKYEKLEDFDDYEFNDDEVPKHLLVFSNFFSKSLSNNYF